MNMDSFTISGSQIIKGEMRREGGGGKGRHFHETKGKFSLGRSQIMDLSENQKL